MADNVNPLRRTTLPPNQPRLGGPSADTPLQKLPLPESRVTDPFTSDYGSVAWYTRFLDLALSFLLAALQATLPHPSTQAGLAGKAVATVAATLLLAAHVLCRRPFVESHAWKAPVRALILILAAACASVNALAGAVDLVALRGPKATTALTAGAYIVVTLFSITLTVLVASVFFALMLGVRAEQALDVPVAYSIAIPDLQQQPISPSSIEPAVCEELGRGLTDVLSSSTDNATRRLRWMFAESDTGNRPEGVAAASTMGLHNASESALVNSDLGTGMPRVNPLRQSFSQLHPTRVRGSKREPSVVALSSIAKEYVAAASSVASARMH